MKLIIIRHGDPDYSIDSLTPTGWEEAELLSERVSRMDVTAFYVSPLGRAQDTAAATLKKMGRTAETLDWLQEFQVRVQKPGVEGLSHAWDWMPADWTRFPEFYDRKKWVDVPAFKDSDLPEKLETVTDGLDVLLAKHGYERDGECYHAVRPNEDTVVLFCHFGLECVLLGHLLGISPMVLWHGTCAAPTSVTTVVTEERQEGIASFRMSAFGDISHLYVAGRKPSFAARFCEMFTRHDQRH